jgi:putative photosynthetic complex assembly protein 2
VIEHGLPALFVILLWWASTGAVLYVIGMPRETFRGSLTMATAVLIVAISAIAHTTNLTTTASAYIGFSGALAVWGWNEMMFLTGAITGPRTAPLPHGATGFARLIPAVEVLIYHELAIFMSLLGIAALTWDQPNQIALWTFVVLWVMRLSAKFNVFFGVPNVAESFLPDHLKYIGSYFRKRAMNGLFPFAVTASTLAAIWLFWLAANATTQSAAVAHTLVATLLFLAVIEHWFMVLPLPSESLWTWGLASRIRAPDTHTASPKIDCTNSPSNAEPGLA